MVKLYDGRFSGLLKRTKTTGAGKRVKELPFFVSHEAWIEHKDWMSRGLEALGRALKGEFDLVIPSGASQPGEAMELAMAYQEAVAWSSAVMREMRGADGFIMLPEGWERFWTEHSERSTLTSGLAALGVPRTDRDLLGRWAPEGSDQYVRTYNAAVTRLQKLYAEPVREGRGYESFDEGAVLEDLKEWLVTKWYVEKGVAHQAVEEWKARFNTQESFEGMLGAGDEKKEQEPTHGSEHSSSDSSSSSSSSSGEESAAKIKRVERLDEERESGYVIVYNRIDRGKLHRGGKKGCWMAKQRK